MKQFLIGLVGLIGVGLLGACAPEKPFRPPGFERIVTTLGLSCGHVPSNKASDVMRTCQDDVMRPTVRAKMFFTKGNLTSLELRVNATTPEDAFAKLAPRLTGLVPPAALDVIRSRLAEPTKRHPEEEAVTPVVNAGRAILEADGVQMYEVIARYR